MNKTINFRGYRITLDRELENKAYDLIWNNERTKLVKLVDFEAIVLQIKTLKNQSRWTDKWIRL